MFLQHMEQQNVDAHGVLRTLSIASSEHDFSKLNIIIGFDCVKFI
jgi:hypothetical protein